MLRNLLILAAALSVAATATSASLNEAMAKRNGLDSGFFSRHAEGWFWYQDPVEEEPEWTLDIWGSGNEYESLKSLIGETGLEKHVFLKGTSQRIEAEYNQASLFVLSSRYEGFALVLLEAMNAGLPCVSFNIPGCNNLISDGDNGIIAKERTTACLADSILKYIRLDKEEKLRMQSNALTTVAKYSKERVMQMWMQLFDSLYSQYKVKR